MEKVLNTKGCVGVLDYNLAMKNTEHNILMKMCSNDNILFMYL